MKSSICVCLFVGYAVWFARAVNGRSIQRFLQSTKTEMEDAARERSLEKRTTLFHLQPKRNFWYRIEQKLDYCGIKRRFPQMSAEWFVVGNILGGSFLFLTLLWPLGLLRAFLCLGAFWGAEYLLLEYARSRELVSVNDSLLKLLDFLGNYSVTEGEITGIFMQITRYMEEPLRSVLESFCYEAQTTGDTSAALLAMAERIEHPQFKELIRNMEITCRYCADFSVLVNSSRRSMREYLRLGRERKGMFREAAINMLLLLLLSVVSLLTVDQLIGPSIWMILVDTWPGRIAVGILIFIFTLFGGQMMRLNK